jgi:hypothetical protein
VITHKSKLSIVNRLVKAESLQKPHALARELKLMKQLADSIYDDAGFWFALNLGFQLNSLAWFRGDGKGELEKQWRLYERERKQKLLDSIDKAEKLIQQVSNQEQLQEAPAQPPKQTVFDWVDSK